jgi:hypothetical protein
MEAIGITAAATAGVPEQGLLERAAEVAAIDGALAAAASGTGACVLVERPPGLGKSSLCTRPAPPPPSAA